MKKLFLPFFCLGFLIISFSLAQPVRASEIITCSAPNSCMINTECPGAVNQIVLAQPTCGDGKVCCKPKCAPNMCLAKCDGTFEPDPSKSVADCPADKKVCCKTKTVEQDNTATGGTGGATTPGASYDLAPLSPVGTVTIPVLIGTIVRGVLGVIGSIALLMFIYGGFLMLLSQGDPGKIKKGKDSLIWAAAGLVVIFGSYIFVNFIISRLTQGSAGFSNNDKSQTETVACSKDYPTCSKPGTGLECIQPASNSSCNNWCCRPATSSTP